MMNLYRNNFEETGAAAVAVDFVMVAETAVAATANHCTGKSYS